METKTGIVMETRPDAGTGITMEKHFATAFPNLRMLVFIVFVLIVFMFVIVVFFARLFGT
jgi:hypothetical protein